MDWFSQLRTVLADYYPQAGPQDIVGYLRGSRDPAVWRSMIQSGREQMIILGSVPPTDEEWAAAGVANRGSVQTIRFNDLWTFIITYGGFMVTRPWGKISTLTTELYRDYGRTLAQFRGSLPNKAAQKAALIKTMNDTIDALARQADQTSGEQKAQRDIITGSSGDFTGFFGYWTNHLFNEDIPLQTIWLEAYGEIALARSTLTEGKLVDSAKAIVRARSALLKASGIYYRWKYGIDGAGTKMQIAIGAVAVTLIFAAAAATVASAGAGGATALATVEELTSLVGRADTLLVRVVTTAPGGLTAPSAVAYEQTLEEVGEATEQLLRMVK
jgi:hypothetical protein